jgi:uncharacterized RDD family membrane protein YckC
MFQSSRTNVLVIRTPEGIAFPLLLAGPIIRFLAWFIDACCVSVGAIAAGFLFSALGLINRDFANAMFILFYFFLSIGYAIFTEWRWRGQTVGKRLFRLRVMDVQGLRLQFSQIMIRNLLRFVDSLPFWYAIGGIVCFFSKRAQRLGDIAANTIVVRDPDLQEPDLSQVLGGKYNSFREYPHLAARLRQRLSVEEAGIAFQSIVRRDRLNPEARVELFGHIASHFKDVVEFPQEATEGLTDEQYVRNVVDLLFQKRATERRA